MFAPVTRPVGRAPYGTGGPPHCPPPGPPGRRPTRGALQRAVARHRDNRTRTRTRITQTAPASRGLPWPAIGVALVAVVVAIAAAAILVTTRDEPVIGVEGAVGLGAGSVELGGTRPTDPASPAEDLVVDVGGAVARPGVYRLPEGSRVGDAIEAAGGYGAAVDAALVDRQLNLAATVRDGEKIRVPVRGEAAATGGERRGAATAAAVQQRPRRMPASSTSTTRPPRRSTRCPASARRPSRRSWPRVNSSRSPPWTTCWRARSSARRRSRSCGRSSPSGRERGARAGAAERLARRRGCHRCRLGLGGAARGRGAGRRAAGARRGAGGAASGHPGRRSRCWRGALARPCSRCASSLGPAAPPVAPLPDGSGPWTAVVESVGSPRDGDQVARLAAAGRAGAGDRGRSPARRPGGGDAARVPDGPCRRHRGGPWPPAAAAG